MKGGDPDNFLHIPNMGIKSALGRIPNMGIKRALGLDRESRTESQEFAVQKSYSGLPSMPVEAWNINDGTLCEYADLLKMYKDKKLTKKEFEEKEAKLMLYRFRLSEEKYPVSKYPNPMSLKAIIDTHNVELLFLYANTDMKCSATIM
jgi:hypothetical protein